MSKDFKEELCSKLCMAVDKFSPNRQWQIETWQQYFSRICYVNIVCLFLSRFGYALSFFGATTWFHLRTHWSRSCVWEAAMSRTGMLALKYPGWSFQSGPGGAKREVLPSSGSNSGYLTEGHRTWPRYGWENWARSLGKHGQGTKMGPRSLFFEFCWRLNIHISSDSYVFIFWANNRLPQELHSYTVVKLYANMRESLTQAIRRWQQLLAVRMQVGKLG